MQHSPLSPQNSQPQGTTSPKGKKLLEQVSDILRIKHYSQRTEQTYIEWIRRYILFHNPGLSLSKSNATPKTWAWTKYNASSPISPQNAPSPPPPKILALSLSK